MYCVPIQFVSLFHHCYCTIHLLQHPKALFHYIIRASKIFIGQHLLVEISNYGKFHTSDNRTKSSASCSLDTA